MLEKQGKFVGRRSSMQEIYQSIRTIRTSIKNSWCTPSISERICLFFFIMENNDANKVRCAMFRSMCEKKGKSQDSSSLLPCD